MKRAAFVAEKDRRPHKTRCPLKKLFSKFLELTGYSSVVTLVSLSNDIRFSIFCFHKVTNGPVVDMLWYNCAVVISDKSLRHFETWWTVGL